MGEGEHVLCTPLSHFARWGRVIVLSVCNFAFLSCFGVGIRTMFPSKTRALKVIFVCLFVLIKDPTFLWWNFSGSSSWKGSHNTCNFFVGFGLLTLCTLPWGSFGDRQLRCYKKIQKEVWTAEKERVSERREQRTSFEERVYVSAWSKAAEDYGREESALAESPLRQQNQSPLWRHQGFCWVVINAYKVLIQTLFHSFRSLQITVPRQQGGP